MVQLINEKLGRSTSTRTSSVMRKIVSKAIDAARRAGGSQEELAI